MSCQFADLSPEDRMAVIDIFNYYVENSFAAYFESKVGYEFYDALMAVTQNYPRVSIKNHDGELVGFAFLRAHNPIPAFRRIAEVSYFIQPAYVRSGIGGAALNYLIEEARKIGIDSLIASISSLNKPSMNFHLKNGFVVCGVLSSAGKKQGRDFDEVLMQRKL